MQGFVNSRILFCTKVQLIVQDVKPSVRYEASVDRDKKRFLEIKAGALFDESEDIVPTRDDFASVYIFLRKECRRGVTALSERTILSLLNTQGNTQLGYVKFKFIMMILHEMNICTVQEDKEGYYRFDVFYHANKVTIEKSSILKKLKSQCRNR